MDPPVHESFDVPKIDTFNKLMSITCCNHYVQLFLMSNVIYKAQVKGLHYLVYCEATVKCLIVNLMPCLAEIIFLKPRLLTNDNYVKLLNLFHLCCQKSKFLSAVTFTVLKMWLMQYMYNYLLIV